MNHDALFWVISLGAAISGFAAVGVRVLSDFSRHDLEQYCRRHDRRSRFDDVLDDHESVGLAASTLQTTSLVVTVLASGFWFFPHGADHPGVWWHGLTVVVGVSVAGLLLCVWLPWAVTELWSAPVLYHTWTLWKCVAALLLPLTFGLRLVDAVMHRLAGQEEQPEDEEEAFEDEIRAIVSAGLRDGLLEADAREMIEGVIELGDVDVAEIMTPRSEVDALDVQWPWPQTLKYIVQAGRTRLPVFDGGLDSVVGILFAKDLLAQFTDGRTQPDRPLRQLLRPAWFVPESKAVDDLLREFRRTRCHMAIVVDEYHALSGVVTIEDALEEIVGEIADEKDPEQEVELIRVRDGSVEADGRVHVDELGEHLGCELPESDDFDTVAGLIVSLARRIPKAGETVSWSGLRFTVLKATGRRIERVRVARVGDPTVERTA